MQTKWFIRSLLILLAFLGLSLEQNPAPNQQIVVEFAQDNVSPIDAQKTLAAVQEKLAASGAENIQIKETANGTLSITYYSTFDAIAIKSMLFSQQGIALENTSFSNNNPNTPEAPVDHASVYKLDVHELKQDSDLIAGLNGIVLEFEAKIHRYFMPDGYANLAKVAVLSSNRNEKVAFKISSRQSLRIDHFSYKIPEVRAGPIV